MRYNKYSKDLIVTADDFNDLDCNSILNTLENETYSSHWQRLSELAREKGENGDFKSSKIFWILADLCSMMLVSDSKIEPFKSMIISYATNSRSAMLQDFIDNEVYFLQEIVEVCANYKIKSRIADFLWLIKRDIKYIDIAIQNYQLFPLDYEALLDDSKDTWKRVIKLSLWTSKSLDDIQKKLIEEFFKASENNGYHLLWIHNLLAISHLEQEYHGDIYEKLEAFGNYFRDKNEVKKARDYFRACKFWTDDEIKQVELTIEIAKMYELEAKFLNTMASAKFYENSIQGYRTIPRKFRQKYNIEEQIQKLREEMNYANLLSLDNMQKFKSSSVDLTEIIRFSKDFVSGKNLKSAILHFANVQSSIEAEKLKKDVEDNLSKYPLQNMFGATHLSSDGRVIAKRNGIIFSEIGSKEYEKSIFQNMVENYYLDIGLIVQGAIIPAYEQLILEHRITKEDLYNLCNESSAVPNDRVRIWVDGLYFGFEYDFITAVHLLIPQIEHLVRLKMKEANLTTTVLDRDGIEMEKGLSSLLDDDKINEIIDENFIFELKALLTENSGVNLRNNISHGLVNYRQLHSIQVIYLWWFCLRTVINNIVLTDDLKEANP